MLEEGLLNHLKGFDVQKAAMLIRNETDIRYLFFLARH